MAKTYYSFIDRDNISSIIESLKGKTSYTCIVPYLMDDTELLLSRVIHTLLYEVSRVNYLQPVTLTLRELVTYINKLYIRREFIKERNLPASNRLELLEVTSNFNRSNFLKKYNSKNGYLKVELKVTERALSIVVESSSELTKLEHNIINNTLDQTEGYNSIHDILMDKPELTELTEFHLTMAMFALREINIDRESINFRSDNGKMVMELDVAFSQISNTDADMITEEIKREIKFLPQFPESVLRLQKEIMDPEWDYVRISDYILSDSSLTAEILRLVNSPVYNVKERIDKVSIAVKKIGILGLKAILYNFGSLTVLEKQYNVGKINSYKEHLFNVALLSSFIANYRNLVNFSEDIYVAALMHDLGKIIVSSLNPELADKINDCYQTGRARIDILDSLSEGYNHSIIGSLLANKWNFPQKYINAIRYHHSPQNAPAEFKIITYCVYLGNEIAHILDGKCKYSDLNPLVLNFFNLDKVEEFDKLMRAIKAEGLIL